MTQSEAMTLLKQNGYNEEDATDIISEFLSEESVLSFGDRIEMFISVPAIETKPIRTYRITEAGHLVDD